MVLSNMSRLALFVMMTATVVLGQRPSFAGSRPIGYPDTPNITTTEGLGNRFGEDDGTTPRLPIEANGDLDLIDRLSKLPIDNQPFWFINWQALEAHRKKPQTYPQRPNIFIDPIVPNQNFASTSSVQSNSKVNSDSTLGNRFGNGNSNTNVATSNSGISISTNDFNKVNPTSTSPGSAISNSNSAESTFQDTTEDNSEVNWTDKISSPKYNSGTKKARYF